MLPEALLLPNEMLSIISINLQNNGRELKSHANHFQYYGMVTITFSDSLSDLPTFVGIS